MIGLDARNGRLQTWGRSLAASGASMVASIAALLARNETDEANTEADRLLET